MKKLRFLKKDVVERKRSALMRPMQALGLEARWGDTQGASQAVVKRVGLTALTQFEAKGFLSTDEIERYVIPRRTLTHRRARSEPLTVEESDKLLRIARLTEQAIEVFGDGDHAASWLRRASPRFDGSSPLELARTEHGGRVVEEALTQITEGMFA